jgi:hypothetical protein
MGNYEEEAMRILDLLIYPKLTKKQKKQTYDRNRMQAIREEANMKLEDYQELPECNDFFGEYLINIMSKKVTLKIAIKTAICQTCGNIRTTKDGINVLRYFDVTGNCCKNPDYYTKDSKYDIYSTKN